MIKILWLEVSVPGKYIDGEKTPIRGWQDSLEQIVKEVPEIQLYVAFVSPIYSDTKVIDGVSYIPIHYKKKNIFKLEWDSFAENVTPQVLSIINKVKPNLVHIFGTEWPFGIVTPKIKAPVVIHIQGAIVPYNNARVPGFSLLDDFRTKWWNPHRWYWLIIGRLNSKNREVWERKVWKSTSNYMGRTEWDFALANVMHPNCRYFHVEEALRPSFLHSTKLWNGGNDTKLKLFTTGCTGFIKGPDMLLKTASVLKSLGVDFEWKIAGMMPKEQKITVERKLGMTFESQNVQILGYVNPDELVDELCSSTIYVHTAYAENSPNSICEAQILGLPIISTNVGGISTLVKDRANGILVQANDPWQMAFHILSLFKDKERMKQYSINGRETALARHDKENIKSQLLYCYHKLTNK